MRTEIEVIEFFNQMPKEIEDKKGWDSGAKTVLEWMLEEPYTDINGNKPMCPRCSQKMIPIFIDSCEELFECGNCDFTNSR